MKKIISVLVENQAGVLNRITGLFSRRAFNIESLAVGVTDDKKMSRITIIVDSGNNIDSLTVGVTADPRYSRATVAAKGDELILQQIENQVNKLVDVIKVRTIEENHMIGRELILIKVSANTRTRQDILNVCQIMGGKIDDISPTSMTLELSDTTEKVDLFEELLRPFSILEVARTGLVALQKGHGAI